VWLDRRQRGNSSDRRIIPGQNGAKFLDASSWIPAQSDPPLCLCPSHREGRHTPGEIFRPVPGQPEQSAGLFEFHPERVISQYAGLSVSVSPLKARAKTPSGDSRDRIFRPVRGRGSTYEKPTYGTLNVCACTLLAAPCYCKAQ